MASTYEAVAEHLVGEFGRVHPAEIVIRCVEAARNGAVEVIGEASPDVVERIARRHLEVLALVASEGSGRTVTEGRHRTGENSGHGVAASARRDAGSGPAGPNSAG